MTLEALITNISLTQALLSIPSTEILTQSYSAFHLVYHESWN